MSPSHLTNLVIHVGCGVVAMSIGFFMLATQKGTARHRRWGRRFCYFALVVSLSAAVGTIFFRFIPLFAVLTVLVPYQLVSGWRSARTQDRGPSGIDAAWTFLALALSFVLVPILLDADNGKNTVVYSSIGALAMILFYDAARWLFPRRWFGVLWRYEHSYKLIASLFAMLSALIGNVVRVGQPWSQLAPSAAGIVIISVVFYRLYRDDSTGIARPL